MEGGHIEPLNGKTINYFEVLNVSEQAELEVIRSAYKALAKKYHPDTTKLPKEIADAKMALINEAYHVLSDDVMRQRHRDELHQGIGYYERGHTETKESYRDTDTVERTMNTETTVQSAEDEKIPISSYIILIIIIVSLVCCAIYFLPDLVHDTWEDIISSVKEILDTF